MVLAAGHACTSPLTLPFYSSQTSRRGWRRLSLSCRGASVVAQWTLVWACTHASWTTGSRGSRSTHGTRRRHLAVSRGRQGVWHPSTAQPMQPAPTMRCSPTSMGCTPWSSALCAGGSAGACVFSVCHTIGRLSPLIHVVASLTTGGSSPLCAGGSAGAFVCVLYASSSVCSLPPPPP